MRSVLQSLRSLSKETRLRFLDRLFSRPLFARRAFRPLQRLARHPTWGGGVVLTLTRQECAVWLASTRELETERNYADWLSTLRLTPDGTEAPGGVSAATHPLADDVLVFPLDEYVRALSSGGAREWVQRCNASREFAHELLERYRAAPQGGGGAEKPEVLIFHVLQSAPQAGQVPPPG